MTPFSRSLPLGIALALLLGGAITGSMRLRAQAQTAGEPSVDKPAIRRPATAPEATAPAPVESPAPADATAAPKPASAAGASGEDDADSPPDDGEEEAPETDMAGLFPVGRVFEGVKIPSYSGDALGSVVHADYMRRADDEHLEMEMLEIVIYSEGEPDSRILTDRAIYDMKARTLRSTTPAKIVQSQFEMRGDRMLFDSVTRIGHMSGNVKTRIFQVDQLVSPPDAEAAP